MEDTLRERLTSLQSQVQPSLNPCFNGRYSQSANAQDVLFVLKAS